MDKAMNIAFVWTDVETNFRPTGFHIGIAYLSAALKHAGHKTSLVRLNKHVDKDVYLERLRKNGKPDILAFSVMTNQYEYCAQLAGWSKDLWADVPVLFGGHHPSLAPEEVIACPGIDMLCRGEAEESLLELITRMEQNQEYWDVKSFLFKKNGEVIKNEIRALTDH